MDLLRAQVKERMLVILLKWIIVFVNEIHYCYRGQENVVPIFAAAIVLQFLFHHLHHKREDVLNNLWNHYISSKMK